MIFCSYFWLLCHVHWGSVLLLHTQEIRNHQYGKFAHTREKRNCIFWESPGKEHNFSPWWLTDKFIAGRGTVFIHSRLTYIRISTVSLLLLRMNKARLLERSMLSFKSTGYFLDYLEASKDLCEVLLCCRPGSESPVVFGPILSDKSVQAGTWHYLLGFVVWCHSSKESDRIVNNMERANVRLVEALGRCQESSFPFWQFALFLNECPSTHHPQCPWHWLLIPEDTRVCWPQWERASHPLCAV